MKIQFQNEQLCIFESALYRTNTSVLVFEKLILLVDPNWLPEEIKTIQKHVNKVQGDKDLWLLFTHSDYDHIIACGAFKADRIIASRNFKNQVNKESILNQIKTFDEQYYIQRDYPIYYPEVDYVVEKDEQILTINEIEFHFYLAPGHTNDGIFTLIQPFGILIAGDYLSNVEFPFIYDSSRSYLKTLEKASRLVGKTKVLIVGHGDHTQSKIEMKQRIKASKKYIEALELEVKTGTKMNLDVLLSQYDFPNELRKSHEANLVQLRKNS